MGSRFREQLTHWTDPTDFTQPDQWKGFTFVKLCVCVFFLFFSHFLLFYTCVSFHVLFSLVLVPTHDRTPVTVSRLTGWPLGTPCPTLHLGTCNWEKWARTPCHFPCSVERALPLGEPRLSGGCLGRHHLFQPHEIPSSHKAIPGHTWPGP